MTVTEALRKIKEALQSDDELIDYCLQRYGRRHRVYLGLDLNAPPEAADYPLIAITYRSSYAERNLRRFVDSTVTLFVGITYEGREEDEHGNREYAGVAELEDFAALVRDRVCQIEDLPIEVLGFEPDFPAPYPVWTGRIEVSLKSVEQRR